MMGEAATSIQQLDLQIDWVLRVAAGATDGQRQSTCEASGMSSQRLEMRLQ
jgi:hypothetical protein